MFPASWTSQTSNKHRTQPGVVPHTCDLTSLRWEEGKFESSPGNLMTDPAPSSKYKIKAGDAAQVKALGSNPSTARKDDIGGGEKASQPALGLKGQSGRDVFSSRISQLWT